MTSPGGRRSSASAAPAQIDHGSAGAPRPRRLGDQAIEVRGRRSTLAGTETLAGSVIGLDTAVRNLVRAGIGLTDALAAASATPARLLGLTDRGWIAVGMRADLVELDDELRVVGTMLGGRRVR